MSPYNSFKYSFQHFATSSSFCINSQSSLVMHSVCLPFSTEPFDIPIYIVIFPVLTQLSMFLQIHSKNYSLPFHTPLFISLPSSSVLFFWDLVFPSFVYHFSGLLTDPFHTLFLFLFSRGYFSCFQSVSFYSVPFLPAFASPSIIISSII